MMTSKTDLRYTPQDVFDKLDYEFDFNLDPCATDENYKCRNYFTKEQDWLKQDWDHKNVFMNPPYWREIGKRIEKASKQKWGIVVCLLPSRTDTKWFHNYIYNRTEIRFLKGRLKFWWSKNSAPFPSMIVIFRNS